MIKELPKEGEVRILKKFAVFPVDTGRIRYRGFKFAPFEEEQPKKSIWWDSYYRHEVYGRGPALWDSWWAFAITSTPESVKLKPRPSAPPGGPGFRRKTNGNIYGI